MTKPIVKIHNSQTGEEIEREMNAKEFAQYEIDQKRRADQRAEAEIKATTRAALLDRLGITAEEAALLLG
jgi:hypothetical protein